MKETKAGEVELEVWQLWWKMCEWENRALVVRVMVEVVDCRWQRGCRGTKPEGQDEDDGDGGVRENNGRAMVELMKERKALEVSVEVRDRRGGGE